MTFDNWFNEVEGYALRSERFYEDLDYYRGDNPQVVLRWLKAAYEVGYKHGQLPLMDDGK